MAMTVGKGVAAFFGNALIQAGKMSYSKYLGEEQRAAAKADREEQRTTQRKDALEDAVFQDDMKARNDPNAPPDVRKAATDRLNEKLEGDLGRQDNFVPAEGGRGGVPNLGQVPGPYLGDPYSPVVKPKDLPPGFQSWPAENKTAWLKEKGMIPDTEEQVSPYDQARINSVNAQAGAANALKRERDASTAIKKKQLTAEDKNKKDWKVQQQIDVYKDRSKNLRDELEQYRDKDFGGFKKENAEQVRAIQEELEHNADQMSKATGVPTFKDAKEKQRIEAYFQGILKMGIDEKKAYVITKAFQAYVQGGFTPEEADTMVYQKYIRRLK